MYLLLAVAAGYTAVWLWGMITRSYDDWFKVGGSIPFLPFRICMSWVIAKHHSVYHLLLGGAERRQTCSSSLVVKLGV